MSFLVFTVLLVLGGNRDSYLSCILKVLQDPVELVGVDGIFGLPVSLP